MNLHKPRLYLFLAVLLGVAVAVLPSVASSSTTASITAVDPYSWQASGVAPAEVGITPGGTVSFSYPSGVREHYPVLHAGPAEPACSGLPTGGALAQPPSAIAATAGWSGSCKFSQAGTYEFWCGIHGALMKSFIYVNAGGTVPVKTPPPPPPPPPPPAEEETTITTTTTSSAPVTTTTTTAQVTTPPATSIATGTVTTTTQSETGRQELTTLTPLALTLAKTQKGAAVRGSAVVVTADRGARLEVDVLAKSATLAAAKRSSAVRVGRYTRASVPVGKLSFTVTLNAKAKRALRRHGHLAVTMLVILTPAHGKAVSTTRRLTLQR